MGGFFILDDGRAFAPNNWGFRATLETVIEALPDTAEGKALAEWLRTDDVVQIYRSVDVRELTPTNKELLLRAVETAFVTQKERGPNGWGNPEFWPVFIAGLDDFVKMIDYVKKGEPAHEFNPYMTATIAPTGERKGPGW